MTALCLSEAKVAHIKYTERRSKTKP